MFNDGLQLAWKALPTQIPALEMDLATRLKNTIAPYFEYDYDKCRLLLNVDQSFARGNHDNGMYMGSLFFNTRFYELLSGLACNRQSRDGDLNYSFVPDLTNSISVKDSGGLPQ